MEFFVFDSGLTKNFFRLCLFLFQGVLRRSELVNMGSRRLLKLAATRIAMLSILRQLGLIIKPISSNVWVENYKKGQPYLIFSKSLEAQLNACGISTIKLSISYEKKLMVLSLLIIRSDYV